MPDPTTAHEIEPTLSGLLPEMARLVSLGAPEPGVHATAWPALSLIRADRVALSVPSVYEPSLCVVVQGSKRAMLGPEQFEYDAGQYLVASMTLPTIAHITQASVERPYLCVRLSIHPGEMAQLMMSLPAPTRAKTEDSHARALYTAPMSLALMDVLLRLLRALQQPHELEVLGPILMREIYYRVLSGPMGQHLHALVDGASHARRISRAIELIKHRFNEPLQIPDLANELYMSASSLHHRFKQLTAMTPLQFQKQLRLHEARRLMLGDGLAAAQAAHRVGYDSPSQFSRDYRRLFGNAPRRSIRAAASTS